MDDGRNINEEAYDPFNEGCRACSHQHSCLGPNVFRVDAELRGKLSKHLPLSDLKPMSATIMSKLFGSDQLTPAQQHALFSKIDILSQCQSWSNIRDLIAETDEFNGAEPTVSSKCLIPDPGVPAVLELLAAVLEDETSRRLEYFTFGQYLGLSSDQTSDVLELAGFILISRMSGDTKDTLSAFDQCFTDMSHATSLFRKSIDG